MIAKKVFVALALAVVLFGTAATTTFAKTKCDNSVPPACEEVRTSGARSPMFFFKALGITISPEVAREAWRHPELRDRVIELWRIKVFGN